jgi:hypothetical protein
MPYFQIIYRDTVLDLVLSDNADQALTSAGELLEARFVGPDGCFDRLSHEDLTLSAADLIRFPVARADEDA